MANFINPFTDVGFKRIFGQEISKSLLIDFLNNLLKGERCIVDLTFLDKEQIPTLKDERSLIYDVYCEIDNGEHIIVEMQNKYQPYFKNRSIYYISKSIIQQGERGVDWYYDVKAVYLVAFLNFRLKDISDEFRTDVGLMNLRTHEPFSDKFRLIYLQLPLFQKEAEECETDFERWIYVLKNMETLNRLPFDAQNSVFQKLASITNVAALTRQERRIYDESLRQYRDAVIVMEGQRAEGRAEGWAKGKEEGIAEGIAKGMAKGMAKGKEEGIAEGQMDMARNVARWMKGKGMSTSDIVEATQLSQQEIESL